MSHVPNAQAPILITGGAGFVGINLADRLLLEGRRVLLLDSLCRAGVEGNVRWLRSRHGEGVRLQVADVRDRGAVAEAVSAASAVFHLAAQVAVTASLSEPVDDFEINAHGTLNVLEALRALREPVPLIFTSTNKVYGALDDVRLRRRKSRYEPGDRRLAARGMEESRALDFHSPYACSKGAADQYVADYARSYGLPTVTFRMGCIYGPHQQGTEDQGWVAHFLIQALRGQQITIYGDGRQVRDILYVDDVVDALRRAQEHATRLAGRAFNIGGGAANAVSLLELIDLIEELQGDPPVVRFEEWRRGDQRYFVADTGRFWRETGWMPRVSVRQGVQKLRRWLREEGGHAVGQEVMALSSCSAGGRPSFSQPGGQRPSRATGT